MSIWKNKSWNGKRLLYTLCFAGLVLIDYTRHTHEEMWWGPLVNCAGLLFMLITFSACKREDFRHMFCYLWTGAMLLLTGVTALFGAPLIWGIYKWTLVVALVNVWMIGLLAFRTARLVFVEKTVHIHWNLRGILWIVMTVLMTISPFRAVWPIWFFCVFGLFHLTEFTEKDAMTLRESIADGIILGFFILQIFAYGYRPYDEVRYKGAFSGCNMAALHYLMTYVAVLFKLHFLRVKGSKRFWKIFYFVGAAGVLGFLLLTMTRTTWIIAALLTVMYGILVMRNLWGEKVYRILLSGVALAVATALLFPAVYATVRWLPPLRHHPVWYAGEWSEGKVQSSDPATSDKYVSFEEVLSRMFGRIGLSISRSSWSDPFVLEAQAAETSAATVSSADAMEYRTIYLNRSESEALSGLTGRLGYMRAYLEDLNWIGHNELEGHYYVAGTNSFVWHSQCVWVQLLYYFGIPAGSLFIMLAILTLARQIRACRAKERTMYSFMPLFVSTVFVIFGSLEVVWLAGQFILFMVYFMQHPMFVRGSGEVEKC